jgi:hypothetical protein
MGGLAGVEADGLGGQGSKRTHACQDGLQSKGTKGLHLQKEPIRNGDWTFIKYSNSV